MWHLKDSDLTVTKEGHVRYADARAPRDELPTRAVVATVKISDAAARDYDVIVIGAGFAGLTTARDLSRDGYRVLVVESRDRIGGRTFAARVDGYDYEIGGTWIHWSQPHVWSEVVRYGLSIKESLGATPETISYISGGVLKHAAAADVWEEFAEAMAAYCNVDGFDARTVFPRAHDPMYSGAVAKYDHMSLADRLAELNLRPEIRDMIGAMLALDCHGDPATAGLVDQLRWWALGDHEMGRMFDKCGKFKIKEGTTGLALAMLEDSKADLLLSTKVVKVDQGSDVVKVCTASGETLTARQVVCALPMNVLKNVEFNPALSAGKLAASRAEHAGKGTKFWVKIDQKIGNWFGMAPYPSPVLAAWTDTEAEDGSYVVCFGSPDRVDVSNLDEVQAAVRTLLPDATVKTVIAHDWAKDEASLGTWCFYRQNQLTSALEVLQSTDNRVFFAGSDWANGWRGFIDGAIESGTVAAVNVRAALRSEVKITQLV
ncbi:flavin monoamine oxidase family protein [Burkholderia multivorans]|uniref:flavin monoamine oxidase family protein n=1 Tax=Burkholderia multivorans TaxID=87883 RepID=UPI001C2186CB|nr:NAD(P)/FAD-dependent oxidoreductase [Burkholderia multivorans]MBU9224628.1 FAD-dependent oxidoreductase [Burkholderia multivorans]MBU9418097.1 FAD-dependent oxidoreductase [Burkholderia multivorans]MBU9479605.1 FAD-dependent oxidoreductase [Burkholderia multivorans]